jgi:hypothetical protein
MKTIFKLSAIRFYIYFIISPFVLFILLMLATAYISPFFLFLLIFSFFFSGLSWAIYIYKLGLSLYQISEVDKSNELKRFRLTIVYFVYALVFFILFVINVIVKNSSFELSHFHIFFLLSISPLLILQFYIPKFISQRLIDVEKRLFQIENDYDKTFIDFRYPITRTWKFQPRIKRIFEFIENNK